LVIVLECNGCLCRERGRCSRHRGPWRWCLTRRWRSVAGRECCFQSITFDEFASQHKLPTNTVSLPTNTVSLPTNTVSLPTNTVDTTEHGLPANAVDTTEHRLPANTVDTTESQ
jgi:hypothetical protein